MIKNEIVKKLQALETRVDSLGDIPAKIVEIESYIGRAKAAVDAVDAEKQKSSTMLSSIQATQQQIDVLKSNIEVVSGKSDELQNVIKKQEEQSSAIELKINKHEESMTSLENSIKDQLGSVGAKVLANAFAGEANNLRKSVSRWLTFIIISTGLLFLATIMIVIWELMARGDFWNTNFLIKASITTPIIYFVFFTARQYGREKRLLDEYSFKSSVALSFEAFRKIIKEDGSGSDDHKSKILNFIIASVSGIYASPLDDVYKHKEDDDKGILQPAVEMLELAKIPPQKNS